MLCNPEIMADALINFYFRAFGIGIKLKAAKKWRKTEMIFWQSINSCFTHQTLKYLTSKKIDVRFGQLNNMFVEKHSVCCIEYLSSGGPCNLLTVISLKYVLDGSLIWWSVTNKIADWGKYSPVGLWPYKTLLLVFERKQSEFHSTKLY